MNAVKKFLQPTMRHVVAVWLIAVLFIAMQYVPSALATGGEISVLDGNNAVLVSTSKTNVQEILNEAGIVLNPHDIVTPALTQNVPENGEIFITRVEYAQEIVEASVPNETQEAQSAALVVGSKEIATQGVMGTDKITYYVKRVNGEETERTQLSRVRTAEPQNEVIHIGSRLTAEALEAMGARAITCVATAYDGSYATLGYHNPKTALGKTPTVGTVAVDPRVIPLGTKLYIETTDGSYVYGESFAGDTGGAIKGNRVDLFMASRSEALSFGRRQVKVYILD